MTNEDVTSATEHLITAADANNNTNFMRAAVIAAPGKVDIVTVPKPQPGPGEVLIRLEGCGVCASNLPPWEGREWFSYPMPPGALGHEGWGRIDKLGADVSGLAVGERVTMLSYHAYAQYDVAPADAVVCLPDTLAKDPFPGEPLGCAMNIIQRSAIRPGQTVAIVGLGFLGVLLTQLAARAGAYVIGIGRPDHTLILARQQGAQSTLLMEDHWQIIEQVKQLTSGNFCDVVIEAVGKQWPLDLAAELTKVRGRLVIAGYHQDGLRQVNMQLWNWRGLDVINAHEREQAVYIAGIQAATTAVASGTLTPAGLYTHRFTLEQLDAALNTARDRPEGFMKALVIL